MCLMEAPPPSKSQAVFYQMQNKLHLTVTEQRHIEKNSVRCCGEFLSLLTGHHPSLSRALGTLKVQDASLMGNAFLLSLPPRATAYIDPIAEYHTLIMYLFLVLSCLNIYREVKGTFKGLTSHTVGNANSIRPSQAHRFNLSVLHVSTKSEQSRIHVCLNLIISVLIESQSYASAVLSLYIAVVHHQQSRLRQIFGVLLNRLGAIAMTATQARQGRQRSNKILIKRSSKPSWYSSSEPSKSPPHTFALGALRMKILMLI